MTEIPEQVTLHLHNLQRAALRSLLDNAPREYQLDDLLELVVIKGLASLVKDRELPGISEEIKEHARESLPRRRSTSTASRVAADYVGFSIDPQQRAALEELEERFPLADEDELLRILLDVALRMLPHDDIAMRQLGGAP